MSSTVLYPPSPVTPSTPIKGGRPTSTNSGAARTLPTVSTNGSHPSRPRRAAAIASQAATLAASTTSRRKAPSSKSSTSSSSTIPRTPQNEYDQTEKTRNSSNGTKRSPAVNKRPMAALPRAKRARRGDAIDVATHTSGANGSSMHAAGVPLSGAEPSTMLSSMPMPAPSSKHSIVANMDSLLNGHFARTSSQQESYLSGASSSKSRGSAMGSSVREMIGGQEREVYLVNSESPPPHPASSYDNGREDGIYTKGKRKAGWTNGSTAGGQEYGVDHADAAAMTASKRRKKDGAAPRVEAGLVERNLYSNNNGDLSSTKYPAATPRTAIQPGAVASSASYRGGYNADSNYYGQPVRNGVSTYSSRIDQPYGATAAAAAVVPPQPRLPIDDSEGHFIVRNGEYVTERYQIVELLGQGTFGKVVKCNDLSSGQQRQVAIKIIRAIQKYTDAAQIEMRVLRTLRDHDPYNENKCIHLLDTFTYRSHVCIVSELLGQSVFDFLKDNDFYPFPPRHIWSFAKQLLRSVAFLHRLGLVHTDLKPENILLVNSNFDLVGTSHRVNARKKRVLQDTDIRLIDFGSATFNDEYHSQVVSTRHYRAPEIILQMGWSFPCDAWSIGCILIEFYTGEALFQTHDNLEHLAMMEAVLGPMADDFRRKAETYRPNYFRAGRLDFPNTQTNRQSRKYVKQMKPLDETINSSSHYSKHDQRFKHLLKRLLTFDPTHRIRVDQALKHPYFDLAEHEIPP